MLEKDGEPKSNECVNLIFLIFEDLNSHLHFDSGMGIIVTDLKVICTEIIDVLHLPEDLQFGKRANLPLELQ